jgi:hypothetical protein
MMNFKELIPLTPLEESGYIPSEYEKKLFAKLNKYVQSVPNKHIEFLIDIIKPQYDYTTISGRGKYEIVIL